jgi:hypothetical protein
VLVRGGSEQRRRKVGPFTRGAGCHASELALGARVSGTEETKGRWCDLVLQRMTAAASSKAIARPSGLDLGDGERSRRRAVRPWCHEQQGGVANIQEG